MKPATRSRPALRLEQMATRQRASSAVRKTGRDLRAWRMAEGWTRREVADTVGVNLSLVCAWEQGVRHMPASVWPQLDRAAQAKRDEMAHLARQAMATLRAVPLTLSPADQCRLLRRRVAMDEEAAAVARRRVLIRERGGTVVYRVPGARGRDASLLPLDQLARRRVRQMAAEIERGIRPWRLGRRGAEARWRTGRPTPLQRQILDAYRELVRRNQGAPRSRAGMVAQRVKVSTQYVRRVVRAHGLPGGTAMTKGSS